MTGVGVAPSLRMNLGDERADRIDDAQAAALAALADRRCDAVRGQDADLSGRDLLLVVDEDCPEQLEPADDMVVVNDLMPDVDRRAVLGEQPLDDLDRTVHPRAKRTRGRQEDALAHATLSRLRSAPRAPRAARTVTAGPRTKPRRNPTTSTPPSGVAPWATPPSRRVGVSLIARRQPTSRPLRASAPDSMSTASAPVAACSRALSTGSSTIRLAPRMVPVVAGDAPSGPPSQSTAPDSSTTRVASITVPTSSFPESAPAIPNDTSRPSGTPFDAPSPTTAVRPKRRAMRSSTVIAQANVSPSASKPCSSRPPAKNLQPRMPPTARSRNGLRSARNVDRCPARSPPTPSRRAARRTSGRCRPSRDSTAPSIRTGCG